MRRILLGITLTAIFSIVGGAAWIYRDLRTPVYHSKSGQYIEIPMGTSPGAIIQKLADAGVVRHEWLLRSYLKLTNGAAGFKAGEYDFPSPITPLTVFAKLRVGERRLIRLTIVEGWTRWDIANAMARVPELQLEDGKSALTLMDDVSLITDLDPTAPNLEGYLYPDTYEFPRDTNAAALVTMMVKRFRTMWQPEWSTKSRGLNLSPRQVVTVASLIETEAKLPKERPLIASVIYNRLQKDIPLGVDSSIIYASKLAGKWRNDGKVYKSDVERQSPYNTRLHSGLPPGPIASPGESSLVAALNPAQTKYLYYVREPSRDDGAHNFYDNAVDFAGGVEALRNWERERDAENARKGAQEVPLQR